MAGHKHDQEAATSHTKFMLNSDANDASFNHTKQLNWLMELCIILNL
jgi:hypothetical protein